MVFNSLNALIDDIIEIARNNTLAESDKISRIQIEQWIHQYRALLIKQDIDKGRNVSEDYVQTIPLHISKVADFTGSFSYKSDKELPKFIDLHYSTGIVAVKDVDGHLIQLGSEFKAKMQIYRKYTCKDYIAYQKGKHLFIQGPEHLEYVQVAGILEDPTDAGDCFDYDDTPYPMPANMIPTMKQMIFEKEFNIMSKVFSDTTNDSRNDIVNDKSERVR